MTKNILYENKFQTDLAQQSLNLPLPSSSTTSRGGCYRNSRLKGDLSPLI